MAFLMVLLLLSVVWLFVHIFAQIILATSDLGVKWTVGPRDGERQPRSALALRAARASANYQETYPAFLVLMFLLLGMQFFATLAAGYCGMIGAALWLSARVVYLPLYLSGIPWVRSMVWFAAFAGLVLMGVSVTYTVILIVSL